MAFDREKEELEKLIPKFIEKWNTRVYPKEVQEALEKQKPKKLDGGIDKYGFVIGCCKSCDAVIDGDCQYCPHCGQKLDWSDYE